jgi:hypothetical protein
MRIGWIGNSTSAIQTRLAVHPNVSNAQLGVGSGTFQFGGTDDEMAALLADLVGAGVRVKAFGEVKQTVEDLYMKLSQHEVM